ncbi:MAG: diaminopimelate epimerase [Rhodospirillales bacterium]|nr:diaminopimelate epimerase [Rhodospirillales bacterium]
MDALPFLKMHGLGNDFVVVDARARKPALDLDRVRAIADRHKGVGFDQLVVIETPTDPAAEVFFRFLNADGSEAGACGNGTRCVADHVMRETGADRLRIQTRAGLLESRRAADGLIAVDMGPARLDWREIPLDRDCDTLHVPLSLGPLADPVATGMGNPHATFFVPDAEAIDLASLGPRLEHDRIFPERANIGVAQILDPGTLRLRVWERGAGITLACGSGACAATVAAVRRGLLSGRRARVIVDGSAGGAGALEIEWRADGHVLMAGPVALAFSGVWPG